MKYTLLRDGLTVRQIVMVGPITDNNRSSKIVDLEFETYEAALEVATVLKAEVVDNSIKKAA